MKRGVGPVLDGGLLNLRTVGGDYQSGAVLGPEGGYGLESQERYSSQLFQVLSRDSFGPTSGRDQKQGFYRFQTYASVS